VRPLPVPARRATVVHSAPCYKERPGACNACSNARMSPTREPLQARMIESESLG